MNTEAAFRVSDRSGTPQVPILIGAEEYSPGSLAGINSERDPEALRGGTPNTSTN